MAVGIIAEYNPFHNGHLYHLQKVKEMFPNEEIILVMNGNFTQRGEPAIIDKWKRSEMAIEASIDLVVELPYPFATQSADFFSYGAVTLLEKLKVDKFVFGSETGDISLLEEIVNAQLYCKDFDPLVKIYMKLGENYPTALSKALNDLTGKSLKLPNDLLGISYVKAIKKNNYKIKPYCIKRENNYHDKNNKSVITSATSIREALINKEDISLSVPTFVNKYLIDLHLQEDYFKFLKYKILLEKDLSIYQTVDEGLSSKIKKEIVEAISYKDLIEKLKSRRYTYSNLSRMLNHILCGFTKELAIECQEIEYIRVLGFNEVGQRYLGKIKKEVDIPILTNYSKNHSKMLELEFQSSCCYASTLDEVKKTEMIKKEYQYHPKYKEKMSNEKNGQ